MNKGKILVVDGNQGIRAALKLLLPPHFGQVKIIASPATLVSEMETFKPEVVLFMAYADIAMAVEGMRRGAFDFIVKLACRDPSRKPSCFPN